MNNSRHIMSVEEYKKFLNESVINEGLLDRLSGLFTSDEKRWRTAFSKFKTEGNESEELKSDKSTIEDAIISKDKSLKGFFWAKSKSGNATNNAIEGLVGFALTYYNQIALQAKEAKLSDVNDFIDSKAAQAKPTEEQIENTTAVFKFQDANASKKINVYKHKIAQAVADDKDLQQWADTMMGDIELIVIDVATKNANLSNLSDSPEASNAYEKMQAQRQKMFDVQAQEASAKMEKEIQELNKKVEKLNQEIGAQTATMTIGKIFELSGKEGADILTDKEFSNFQTQLKALMGKNGYVDSSLVNETFKEVFDMFKNLFSKQDKKTEISMTSIIGAINAVGFAKAVKNKKQWIYNKQTLGNIVNFIKDENIDKDSKSFVATSLYPVLSELAKTNTDLKNGEIFKASQEFAKDFEKNNKNA